VTRIVVVTSGKGGVGKTTTSASFASGLALRGYKTAVIDFDVGLRNLDLIMGCERRVVYDLVNVLNGEATLTQALIKDKHCENGNLFVCRLHKLATRMRSPKKEWRKFSRNSNTWPSTTSSAIHRQASSAARSWP
jgi:septum formation inhibitor-activating ATPase MinD